MLDHQSSRVIDFHRFLLSQTHQRIEKFRQAIGQVVKPGDVVLDLGTGAGILALLAVRAGAKRVYAVETSDSIDIASALAASEGVADRMTFVRESSFRVELPERADVLISDTFGIFGMQPGGLNAVIDARARLLKADAACIPRGVRLHVCPIEEPELYGRTLGVWSGAVAGVDLSPLRTFAVNNVYPARVSRDALFCDGAVTACISLHGLTDANLSIAGALSCVRAGTIHGLSGWFSAELADDVWIDNAPGHSTTNYAQLFAPIGQPVTVQAGDTAGVSLLSYDMLHLRWTLNAAGLCFDQSTFYGFPISKAGLIEQFGRTAQ